MTRALYVILFYFCGDGQDHIYDFVSLSSQLSSFSTSRLLTLCLGPNLFRIVDFKMGKEKKTFLRNSFCVCVCVYVFVFRTNWN